MILHFSHIGLTDGRTFMGPFGGSLKRGRGRTGTRASATQQDSTAFRLPWGLAGYASGVFDHLSERSREALVLAADEARSLGHDRIGTEHLLLGLVRLGDETTAGLGLTLAGARREVRAILGAGGERTIGELRFTPTAKRAIDRATAEGRDVGPATLLAALLGEEGSGAAGLVAAESDDDAHVLLALAARPDSVTARALAALGVDHTRLRRAVEDVRRR
jgi:ATP-dependent Clp protease ATP-binding subunit ClpC